jgi:hypothetical protein
MKLSLPVRCNSVREVAKHRHYILILDEKGHATVRLSSADRRMADNDEIAEDYLK